MKICFLASGTKQGFYKRDFELLQNNFDVTYFHFPFSISSIVKNSVKLFNNLLQNDVCFAWFADIHSLLAVVFSRILGKKVLTVTGGYDVEVMPEINYGTLDFIHRWISKFVLKYSDLVLPFSCYALKKTKEMQPKANTHMISLYCDTEKFKPSGKKENIVLTVGGVKKNNLKRKGLENFVRAAEYAPDAKFLVVGGFMDDSINYLKSIAPPNVEFTGFLEDEELIKMFQKAKVYCQLSYQEGEGAGGAVGEAMACECVPVVSDKAVALKDTVDDIGFYAPYGNHQETGRIIEKALATRDLGKKARQRMKELFPREKRESKLKNLITKVKDEQKV